MIIVHSSKVRPAASAANILARLESVNEQQLRAWVERISVPRHFVAESEHNRATAEWIHGLFHSMGFRVERQGAFSNVVALPATDLEKVILVGAHYDSVPMCPGADDNGSAVAAMLGCAAACRGWWRELPVAFVAFNCEEDGLRGSEDFVTRYLPGAPFGVRAAHILEMVGYASDAPGSQRVPTGLPPVGISDTGDFLGLLANGRSRHAMDFVIRSARTYLPALPVVGLNVKLGLEKYFPVLSRSDHAPFWTQKIPAVMWTDTAEFRNPHYHRRTDTADTLNYQFLRQVTQLLVACVIQQAEQELMDEN